ncbi:MAG TPA: STAS domain-containing protein [Burkholderiaceae bacterium]
MPDSPADKAAARKKREEVAARSESSSTSETKNVQRKAAHATAMKIDAIESEMSSEFVRPLPASGVTLPGLATRPGEEPSAQKPSLINPKKSDSWNPVTFQPTLPAMGSTTEFLLSSETVGGGAVAISASEAAPVIEEAAILFANGQMEMVEHVLQAAIDEDSLGSATIIVWRMLFDLYQITGNQAQFDHLSIEYANKFETSPPAWLESDQSEKPNVSAPAGVTPTVSFSAALDASIVKQLEKAQNLAEKSRVLRLEFAKVVSVDPIGCGLLLSILKKLQKSGHDLILVGAHELANKIRAILEVGRRDETEAPWLLLLEILRLLNLEKDFEEASIDYCVTFEVSPPAFVAPKNKVITAMEDMSAPAGSSDSFVMPPVIADGVDRLIVGISNYANDHNPAIMDCMPLQRVDFGAAGQLLTGLAPLAAKGINLEFHNVNHLVAALFSIMGLKDIVEVLPRKT